MFRAFLLVLGMVKTPSERSSYSFACLSANRKTGTNSKNFDTNFHELILNLTPLLRI